MTLDRLADILNFIVILSFSQVEISWQKSQVQKLSTGHPQNRSKRKQATEKDERTHQKFKTLNKKQYYSIIFLVGSIALPWKVWCKLLSKNSCFKWQFLTHCKLRCAEILQKSWNCKLIILCIQVIAGSFSLFCLLFHEVAVGKGVGFTLMRFSNCMN